MKKQTDIAVALLATVWLCSTKMIVVQPLPSWLPDQMDHPAMAGLPLPSPPEGEFNQPDLSLQEYPPHQEYETRKQVLPAPEPEALPTPPHHQWSPVSPQMVPPRTTNSNATTWTTMLVFGDSMVDPGNWLQTAAKANFLPYGMNFDGGNPTGRFSNGRLITDILGMRCLLTIHARIIDGVFNLWISWLFMLHLDNQQSAKRFCTLPSFVYLQGETRYREEYSRIPWPKVEAGAAHDRCEFCISRLWIRWCHCPEISKSAAQPVKTY